MPYKLLLSMDNTLAKDLNDMSHSTGISMSHLARIGVAKVLKDLRDKDTHKTIEHFNQHYLD